MHKKEIVYSGKALDEAKRALILIHGRGATAESMLPLADHLDLDDFAILAPQATRNTWYPYSFLMPADKNEPWLTGALDLLDDMVGDLTKKGFSSEQIFISGFSQGACLSLEFAARNARRWGGIMAFTGGLIGEEINTENYKGDFEGTPVFIGTSDPDPHIPVTRARDSARIIQSMNAQVKLEIYPDIGHTVIPEELDVANAFVLS